MKHLQKFLKEMATAGAIAADSVAGVRSSLFSTPIKRKKIKTFKVQKINFHHDARHLRESMLNSFLNEKAEGHFKAMDVISKLKAAKKRHDFGRDTIAFGIEDNEGKTIKVFVRAEQAEAFEKALATILDDEEENNMELPEVLYNLKDKFDIVHIEWGKIEEDEEKLDLSSGDEDKGIGDEGEFPTDDLETKDTENDFGFEDEKLNLEDEKSEAESALDKVITMLKADAEARAAEAKAKEAEAKAREAEYAAKVAELKIKGEQEILDMEAYFKKQNEEKKEAQKLAKLAHYRHEIATKIKDENKKDTENLSAVDI